MWLPAEVHEVPCGYMSGLGMARFGIRRMAGQTQ